MGWISGRRKLAPSHDGLAGFRMGLRDSGLELDEAAVVPGDFTRDGGERSVQDLVLQAPDLTAIFALNDVMAIGALSGLRLLEKRVPDEISLAGFDDIPIARDLMPSLTTVRVPMVQMGT